jgi:hypothetical protein
MVTVQRSKLEFRRARINATSVRIVGDDSKKAKEGTMRPCETCGNEYDKAFEITVAGKSHTFDSFECAIHLLAPECSHCGCKVIGHGVEAQGVFYCCAHCAGREGVREVADRAEHAS